MPGVTANANLPTPGSKYRIKVGQTIGGLVWSNVAYTVDGKWQIIYDDGTPDMWPVVQSASGSSRAAVLWTTGQIAKKNGWVIGGLVFGAAASQRGQSYIQAFVVDANYTPASITDYLAMGYAYASKPVEFGTFVEPGPAGGPGMLRTFSTADPAAGTELADQVVPTGAIWLVTIFTIQLVQGLTQTPLPAFELEDVGGTQFAVIPIMTTALGASTTAQLTWGIGLVQTSFVAVAGDEMYTAPLPRVYLTPLTGPDRFATLTDGIGANTNYGAGVAQVEEWVMPN